MSKFSQTAQTLVDTNDKDSFNGSTLKISSKEFHSDAQTEENERNQANNSKSPSHFDVSNIGVFFSNLPSQPKGSADSKLPTQKKANDPSSNRDTISKQVIGKELGSPEELGDNVSGPTGNQDLKSQDKKISSDMNISRNQADEFNDIASLINKENGLLKHHSKKKSQEKSFSSVNKQTKDEKVDQEVLQNISKLGVNNDLDEVEKAENSIVKDHKLGKGNFDIKVIERIKSKVKPNSNSSSLSDSFKSNHTPVSETRNNNNSLFNGPNKLAKGNLNSFFD